ncbi:bifunctional acetaldehyde-CoA/alcohol dehydrogenase [Streptomyces calidiresistens]
MARTAPTRPAAGAPRPAAGPADTTAPRPADRVAALVGRAERALREWESRDQETVDHIVRRASLAGLARHDDLAALAVEETGRGVMEDKAVKNVFACEHVTHSMRDMRTVGVISRDELSGVTEIAEPIGVVAALTPVTNPTSTTLFKALIALKTRNPIVFAFHPSAQRCSAEAARTIRDAAVAAGAPADCVQWIEEPSREATDALMRHPAVATILATGGNDMVRAAYSCGKPALGVGAGNVPAWIHRTARVPRAVHDVVLSKTFDNGMICAAEQAVILDREIREQALEEFRRLRAHLVTAEEKRLLERLMFGADADGKGCAGGRLNSAVVGHDARWIAERAGFTVPEGTSVLLAECEDVGPGEPLTREKLSPVLAVLTADDTAAGIRLAERMVDFDGAGHSAVVHAEDPEVAEEFGRRMRAVRIIVNAPAALGGVGDIYNSFRPSLTLGCGSWGRTSVSDNVGAEHLLNIKRIGNRTTNMQWFRVPPEIYFERNSLRFLAEMPGLARVTVVTDRTMDRIGLLDRLKKVLRSRTEPVHLQIIDDIEPNPELATVERGAARIREFDPDTIIAFGGGSPIDAAKVMWLLHEHPEVSFADAKEKFFDIRKRAFPFPTPGARTRLVAVPTTSGTGAEVTPFAVISDPAAARKYPLADYALTPNVAIVDPELTTTLPPEVTADSGFDALTHSIEAYVSVYANDYTDGLCLQAIRLIFGNLETCVRDGARQPVARERMHNAATVAGMAFGSAFLGMVHAMAHTLGHTFGIAHGRTNAILLPHVIRHNGGVPTKLSAWPKYETYRAPERYREIALALGLPAATPEEGVESLARAVEDLRDRCGIPNSFRAAGVPEEEYLASLPQQARNAYADQCAPANPRMPMLGEMQRLMRLAYEPPVRTATASDTTPGTTAA